ncbi:MAG TPA: hypothetical protein VI011_24225 [Asanoa sp.]
MRFDSRPSILLARPEKAPELSEADRRGADRRGEDRRLGQRRR